MRARAGQSGCEATEWTSETSARCRMAHGGQGSLRASMTVGSRAGSMTEVVSADMPMLSVMGQGNVASTEVIMVYYREGRMLRPSQSARQSGSGSDSTMWSSDSSMVCRFSLASHASRHLVVTTGLSIESSIASLSFDAGETTGVGQTNLKGSESTSMSVFGSSTGRPWFTSRVRIHHTGCLETRWVSDTSMRCSAMASTQGSRGLVVTMGVSAVYSIEVPQGGRTAAPLAF